jgi:hypothetical protein
MSQVPQLNITCGTTDCPNGHHAFNGRAYLKKGNGRRYLDRGVCKSCGISLVDWPRVHRRNPDDFAYLCTCLKYETIRAAFWNRPFNDRTLKDAHARGLSALLADVLPTLTKLLEAPIVAYWQRLQVPTAIDDMKNAIQYAQHAVAACCRECVEKWHDIPANRSLTKSELSYLSFLVVGFLRLRLQQDPSDGLLRTPEAQTP